MADFVKCAGTTLEFEGVSPTSEYTEKNGVPSKFGITVELAKKAADPDVFDKNSDGKITSKDIRCHSRIQESLLGHMGSWHAG